MMPSYRFFLVFLLAGLASTFPQSSLISKRAFNGIATFNDFGSQGSTVCGPKSGIPGTFGAAASSISPNLAPGSCESKIDQSLCSGQKAVASYAGPSCSKSNCGICYKVTNAGGVDGGPVHGTGNSVTIQIIDTCPATSAFNYCKTNTPANQRCGDGTTDQLDIEKAAYMGLTGVGDGPNLKISIEPVPCPGASGPPPPPGPALKAPAPAPPPNSTAQIPPPPPAPALKAPVPALKAPVPALKAPAPALKAPAPALKAPAPALKAPAPAPALEAPAPALKALAPANPPTPPPAGPPANKTLPAPAGYKIVKGKSPPVPGRAMLVWQNGTKAWGPGP